MAALPEPDGAPEVWADRAFLRDVQYRTDANLAARQSIYAYQQPYLDLHARVLDLAAPQHGETVADVGCGNGAYLAGLVRRGFAGRVVGVDLSVGMLEAARGAITDARAAATAGRRDTPGGVALVAGDAAALPLPDDSADLTFALHMLYHVPDPALAIRELRRVTRPGGRVAVVLNSEDHLGELRAAIDAVHPAGTRQMLDQLRLDAGEARLRTVFPSVTRHDFIAELRVPDRAPVADYVRSMSLYAAVPDPGQFVDAVLSRLPKDPAGLFRFTTHCGCLVCA